MLSSGSPPHADGISGCDFFATSCVWCVSFDPQVDPLTFCNDNKRATTFFLNLYNIMVLHGILHQDFPKEVGCRAFFESIKYRGGGFLLSLDDIEHGILRGFFLP